MPETIRRQRQWRPVAHPAIGEKNILIGPGHLLTVIKTIYIEAV